MVSRRVHSSEEELQGYAELRYMGAGDRSIAWLFVILEQVKLPWYAKARKHCFDYLQYCSYSTQSLFSFLLDLRVPNKYMLQAWNSGTEFTNAVIQASAELTGKHGCNDWEVVKGLGTALGIDCESIEGAVLVREEEGRVVVRYRTRDMDSFGRAPCGHIVAVSDFEGKVRSDSTISVRITCPVPTCQSDISAYIYQTTLEHSAASESPSQDILANIYNGTYLPSMSQASESQCAYCKREKGLGMCSNGCLICTNCALIATFTPFQFRCPYCSERIRKLYYADILAALGDMGKLEEIPMLCDACWVEKPISEYSKSIKEEHICLLCDSCRVSSPQTCPSCLLPKEEASSRSIPKGEEQISSGGMKCALCLQASSYGNFSIYFDLGHTCQICDDCYLLCSTEQSMPCPTCKAQLSSAIHGKIAQIQVFRITSLNAASELLTCGVCGAAKNQYDRIIAPKLAHSCRVCDMCMRQSGNMRQCPRCGEQFNTADLAFLCAIFPQKAQNDGICQCGNYVNQGSIMCLKRCFCSICNLKHFLLTKKAECPKCLTYCQNIPFSGYKCTSCGKLFDLDSVNLSKRIGGICSNGCILCVYCIKIEEGKGVCSCGGNVELAAKTPAEVAITQTSFELGCFCGNTVGPRDNMKCGHEVHRECRGTVPFCRICDYNRQPMSRRQGLRSYAER